MIFIPNCPTAFVNLKFLLMCFEAMSGLKINFERSEAVVTGGDLESQFGAAHMMNCKMGSAPIAYVGMPISNQALRISDFDPIVEKVANKVEPWEGKLLASRGRLILISDCLTIIPMYKMRFMKKWIRYDPGFFFLKKERSKQKYHMINMPSICSPKEVDGLGVINIKIMKCVK